MIGEENEKDLRFIKIIACFIIYSVIGIVAFFIFALTRVEAANFNTIGVREQDVSGNVNNYTNITSLTYPVTDTNTGSGLSRRRYIIYLSYNLTNSNSYSFDVNFKGTISYNGNSKNILNWPTSSVSLYWYDGSKEYPLTCSVTGTQDVTRAPIPATGYDTVIKVYDVLVSCNDIKPSKTMQQVRIKYAYPNITAGSPVLTMQELSIPSKPTITSQTSLDTSAITSNNDANTQKIIENDNKNTQDVIDAIDRQTESNNNINSSITDSSIDNPSNALNGMNNYFGNNGVISDLLLLPVRMFQSIVNTIDGTCSPFNLGTLFGHQLTMPCINLSSRLGTSLYGVIDVLISGFFILTIRKKFVDIFEHFTSLKTGGNELE